MINRLSTQDKQMENRFDFLVEDAKQRKQCKRLIKDIILNRECTFRPKNYTDNEAKHKQLSKSPITRIGKASRNKRSVNHLSVGSYSHLKSIKQKEEPQNVKSTEKSKMFEELFMKLDENADGKITANDLLSKGTSK